MSKSDIIGVLPKGIEYTHGDFAFFEAIYGQKGAVESFRKWCLVHSFLRVARLLNRPFLLPNVFIIMHTITKLFVGRITRSEWLVSRLYYALILLVAFFIGGFVGIVLFDSETVGYFIIGVTYLLVRLSAVSCDVRRLHDLGKGWKWMLVMLFPLAIIPYFFILLLKRGDEQANVYGDVPSKRSSLAMLINSSL